jgi:hypothetical protein
MYVSISSVLEFREMHALLLHAVLQLLHVYEALSY